MKLKILTYNWHEPYLCLLSRLNQDFLVVEPEIASDNLRRWDHNMRPVPDNITLISMAKDNAANTVDIGFYGKYTESATAKYLGLFADASDSNTFKLCSQY